MNNTDRLRALRFAVQKWHGWIDDLEHHPKMTKGQIKITCKIREDMRVNLQTSEPRT